MNAILFTATPSALTGVLFSTSILTGIASASEGVVLFCPAHITALSRPCPHRRFSAVTTRHNYCRKRTGLHMRCPHRTKDAVRVVTLEVA